ncbi:ArsR family transcriptional regulator [Paraburkholderia fungorum]|jgi:DNA-binding transcriptional ArsR family regulator|uniref:ArsR family transcriptional regulator n=1 Tax=Paraburkholderia fungorum TaxID=134537 RepID=A0AAP5Q5R7_9BURK|nr:helix-turn-helix transcriptional regulator [Paraburkholderia fungorum]MDT8837486.1 ArsR family transcriptional regulator [Paraburkholderia fungorum]PRZ52902.1 ArsR family transcriptional regulator [Paraburkholderia fungorum]
MGQHNISSVAHLIAEPVRSVMLITLVDGSAMSAGALARAAGVTAQTASSHLAKLLDGGLLSVESKGRHRYYRLAGAHVSHVLESLATIGPVTPAWRHTPNRPAQALRFARCCYDHLAGQISIAVTQSMLTRGFIVEAGERQYAVTAPGCEWLQQLGIDMNDPAFSQASEHARQCLDWTERQYHVAGPLGARLMDAFLAWGWISRSSATRSVSVTALGWEGLKQHFGISRDACVPG